MHESYAKEEHIPACMEPLHKPPARVVLLTKTQPPGAVLKVTAHQNAQRDTRAFSGHALPAWRAHTRPKRVMDYVYYAKPIPTASELSLLAAAYSGLRL